MNIQTFFTSKIGIKLGIFLGKYLSPQQGYFLAKIVAHLVSKRRHSQLIRTIRANQSVVRGLRLDSPLLDEAVHKVLLNAGRGYYDLYHALAKNPATLGDLVELTPEIIPIFINAQQKKQGIVIAIIHSSNFDLAAAAFAHSRFTIQMLTYPNPTGGYELQNQLRTNDGYIVTPATRSGLKMALRRLREGGIVLTGIDRPLILTKKESPVSFFGKPAHLPTGHIRLAMASNALLVFASTEQTDSGKYKVRLDPPMELIRTGNRQKDILINTERLLALAEERIRARPEEWMMFFPVWPQVLDY